MGRFRRFIVEYVGNLSHSPRAERRSNWHARELMDWIKAQIDARGLPASKKEELVHGLRRVLRQEGAVQGGASANDAIGEGTQEWVPETKGISRDAPS